MSETRCESHDTITSMATGPSNFYHGDFKMIQSPICSKNLQICSVQLDKYFILLSDKQIPITKQTTTKCMNE